MSLPRNKAWFGAKTYGYGWGLPRRWQGWAVFLGYLSAVIAASFLLAPKHVVGFFILLWVLTLGVLGMCMWKGEQPRWRWGGEPDEDENA
ncbi:MAG: hypothetical protein AB9869_33970 [Verrucomicrobiia bacterium]